jgi:hypothetical protein
MDLPLSPKTTTTDARLLLVVRAGGQILCQRQKSSLAIFKTMDGAPLLGTIPSRASHKVRPTITILFLVNRNDECTIIMQDRPTGPKSPHKSEKPPPVDDRIFP